MDQATTLREMVKGADRDNLIRLKALRGKKELSARKDATQTRIVAITSGKGGVGKTNVVANLAYALTGLDKSVLILDADLGLGNIDVLLGLAPRYNLQHVFLGEKGLKDILLRGPGGVRILPAGSGVQDLAELSEEQQRLLIAELEHLYSSCDIFLIDTGAGISSNVINFNLAAGEIIVVVSPEPTSLMDAYALLKLVIERDEGKRLSILVNSVNDEREAIEVYQKLKLVTERFLHINIDYLGYILFDRNLRSAVKSQRVFIEAFPGSIGSRCFHVIARRICQLPIPETQEVGFKSFWKRLTSRV